MRKDPFLAAVLAAATLALSACVPVSDAQVTKAPPAAAMRAEAPLPAPAFLAAPVAARVPMAGQHGDAEMAATFMELTFALESGRRLDTFSRFEGPVTVALSGQVPPGAAAELTRVIARFRSEAGIDIRPAQPGERASITIDFNPKAALRRAAPTAACFVVPNVSSLAEYKAKRGSAAVDWANVAQRQHVAIFAPSDASPQEVRDCLHEETAQALGPLNDLYRLSDSVFNDDNFNSVLTPFDMTILRAYYAPDLSSGMSRAEVQARIGAVMARENPGGPGQGGADLSPTPRAWITAVEMALMGGHSQATRRAAAERALSIARAQGWRDGRLAFSHFAAGRLYVGTDRARALAEFSAAATLYRGLPGGAIHVAHIDMQLAALALAAGQADQASQLADRALPAIRAAQNHALLATVQLIKAQALEALGRPEAAEALRVDSRAAARYGFGTEAQIRARQREIAALGGQWGFGG